MLFGFGFGIGWLGYKCEKCNGLGEILHSSDNSNLNKVCTDCGGIGSKNSN